MSTWTRNWLLASIAAFLVAAYHYTVGSMQYGHLAAIVVVIAVVASFMES